MRFLLVGNYGAGNLGDEALKDYFLRAFPEIQWTVISARPRDAEIARLPMGLRSLLGFQWLRTIKAFRQSRGLVFGGGTLFTDQESLRACLLWSLHVWTARVFGKPYFLAFQGIGPFRTKAGASIARWVVRHAAFVSVRDPLSADRMRSWDMNTKVIQSFDPIFRLMHEQKSHASAQKIFIIIPRASDHLHSEKYHIPEEGSVRILLLEPDNATERALAEKIRTQHPSSTIVPIRTLAELLQEVSAASSVTSARYHGALAAIALGKEVHLVRQREGDKVSSLAHLPSREELLRLVEAGERELKSALHTSGSR